MSVTFQDQDDVERKSIHFFKAQIVSLVASLLLLILSNAQIKIFSFICVLILPITLFISLYSGMRAMIYGQKGWKIYRSKSARRIYHLSGAVVFTPFIITVLVVSISIISEFFS